MDAGSRSAEGSSKSREAAFGPRRCPEHGSAQLPNQRTTSSARSRSGCSPREDGAAAVFLDRDGVLNDQTAFVNKPEDFNLLPGAAAAVARLNRAGIPVVVITNQGGVALGYLTEDDLAAIHERMTTLLAAEGAHADGVYFCPHLPNATVTRYLKECSCRKPGTGMLEKARDELGLDLRKSILVRTGYAGKDGKAVAEPDRVAADLSEAASIILDEFIPAATSSGPSKAT